MAQRKMYWQKGWIASIDTGETNASTADLYITPTLPATNTKANGHIDPNNWNYKHSFAIEVESYPQKHWDRLENNYIRNKQMGFPTVFIVPNQIDADKLKTKLTEWKATLVTKSTKFEPDHPEMAAIEIDETLGSQNRLLPFCKTNPNSP